MNAGAALAASARVLGCYRGLKIHPGGVRGLWVGVVKRKSE